MDAPEGFVGVRLGGIVRFFPLPAQAVEKPVQSSPRVVRPPKVCACGKPMWGKTQCWTCFRATVPGVSRDDWHQHEDAIAELMGILERTLGRTQSPWVVCDDCGCLLRPSELCPACVIPWIRAHDHVDDVAYYQPQKTLEERRAA